MGVEEDRVTFAWVSASEGIKWQQVVNETTARAQQLKPFGASQDQAVRYTPMGAGTDGSSLAT